MINPESLNMPPLDLVLQHARNAPSDEEKLLLLLALSGQSPDDFKQVLLGLLAAYRHSRAGLDLAEGNIKRAQLMIDKLTAPPLFPAIFLRLVDAAGSRRAEVKLGGVRRIVELAPNVPVDKLIRGQEVYLAHEVNVIVALAPHAVPVAGEVAEFVQQLAPEFILAKCRDEQLVLHAAEGLAIAGLQPGDPIGFSRESLMVFNRVAVSPAEKYFFEDIANLSAASVGGQDDNLLTLLSTLRAALLDPKGAARFGVTGRNTILLTGPPGCGKTLMARVATSEVSRLAGRRARFAVVKPGELESPWVGETQRNIREFFKVVNREARDAYCVIFLDELESWGAIRGTGIGHHDDKALTALLCEIEGFKGRENVAIIAASNRPDLIDASLLERCSETRVEVSRPDLAGAKAIFKIHLPGTLPFSPNGAMATETHSEVVETAVSLLYAPNADNEICRLRFRDGKERLVTARELVSGRLIEQIAKQARFRAFLRHLDTKGESGITVADIQDAVGRGIERLRQTLTPVNVRSYLEDLPQDIDVIAVERIKRKVKSAHRNYNPSTRSA